VETLTILRHDAVGEIRFNRPEVLNAMGGPFPQELRAAAEELEADPAVRAVLLTGAGRAFSSGLDLDDLVAGRIDTDWFIAAEHAIRRLETMDKAVIAGVQGWCLGGGVQVAIACDIRIAADDATFGLPAAKEAFLPGMGTWRLPRLIGMGHARHLILSGEAIDAAEAARIGLVHKVVPRDDLDAELHAWAKRYAEVPRPSLAAAKRLTNLAYDLPFEAFVEAIGKEMAAVLATEEHMAARRAWADRPKRS
jgi:enoyl-CoA hydratase/carnithine racemase